MDETTTAHQSGRPDAVTGQACLNCASPLEGAYCSACGQRAEDPRRLVVGLVQDVIVDTMSIDGKLARTLRMLLLRPASLARDVLDGRRVRYTAPFRLYLFSSLVFFLLLWTVLPFSELETSIRVGAGDPPVEAVGDVPDGEADPGADPGPVETPAEGGEAAAPEEMFEGVREIDCGLAGAPPDTLGERLCTGARHVLVQLEGATHRVREDPRVFFLQVRSNIPRAMLLAPLVYALVMLALYIYRRRILVYDHLVVSLYMHAALYGYLSIYLLAGRLPLVGGLAWLVLAWGWLQAFLVFRRAYGSGWVSSVLKFSLQTLVYYVSVALLLVLGLGYALYQS